MAAWNAPLALVALLAGSASARTPAACAPAPSSGPGAAARYDSLILRQAGRRRLNPRLVKAIIAAESQFAAGALSRSGARGLMQLMPATAREMGAEPAALWDPEENIRAGTKYLAVLFAAARKRGARPGRELTSVIAAYHDGPSALSGNWPAGTKRYVRVVLSCYRSDVAAIRRAGSAPGPRLASAVAETEGTW